MTVRNMTFENIVGKEEMLVNSIFFFSQNIESVKY